MISNGPVLDKMMLDLDDGVDLSSYPFSLNIIRNLKELVFPSQVTFFVGENGSGKSTLMETIANRAGYGKEGGSKSIHFNTASDAHYSSVENLARYARLSWRKKVFDGFFFRAESFFNVGNYLDDLATHPLIGRSAYNSYGDKSLHEQSHGESFLAFFKNRLSGGGLYILDEPEAALSPQRQLVLLSIMHKLCKNPETQFIIASHSPILLAYPGATIYSCDGDEIQEVKYEDTKHYEITKGFLDNPERYMKHLFND